MSSSEYTYSVRVGNYSIGKILGTGQFGVVYKATHIKTGAVYALKKIPIKRISPSGILERLFRTEVAIMHEIDHPNILHLHEFLETSKNYYLVFDYCDHGDLGNYLKSRNLKYLPEIDAIRFLQQIANGFQELRKRKILHRDFKLENIFVHGDRIIIGDFGVAKMGSEISSSYLGTPITMAYEILHTNTEEEPYYNRKGFSYNSLADLWSVAVVYYQLLFGDLPFKGESIYRLLNDIESKANGNLKYPHKISKESQDLINRILITDPTKRMTWDEFFNHELFDSCRAKILKEPNALLDKYVYAINVSQVKIDQEFFRNRSIIQNTPKENMKAFRFLDYDDFLSYNSVNLLLSKDTNIVHLSPKETDNIKFQCRVREFQCRYGHEKNKILFMVFVTMKIHKYMQTLFIHKLRTELTNLMLIILKKAIRLNQTNIDCLWKHQNVYNINTEIFDCIKDTNSFSRVIKIFEDETDKLKNYQNHIINEARVEKIQINYLSIISQEFSDTSVLDEILQTINENMQRWIRSLKEKTGDAFNQLQMIWVMLVFCQECDKRLPYEVAINGEKIKFQWNEFYIALKEAIII